MSTSEIKASIDAMTEEERFYAAAYLQLRFQEKDPAYAALLSARLDAMNAGKKVSFDQLKRIHEALESEGL